MAIGTLLTLGSILAQAYGTGKSAQANKDIDDYIQGRSQDLQSAFDRDYNKNFFDTDQAKSVIQTLKNQYSDSLKKVAGDSVVGGSSVEAKVGASEKLKGTFDDALTKLAGYGTQYKDNLRREFNRRDDTLSGLTLANMQGKSENFSNLADNAMSAIPGFASLEGGAADKKLTDAFGNIKGLFGKKGFGKGEFI